MGKFVHERLEACTGGGGKPNSMMEAPSVMYSYFMAEIVLKEVRRRSASEATMKSTKLSKATNPLLSNFCSSPKKVRSF